MQVDPKPKGPKSVTLGSDQTGVGAKVVHGESVAEAKDPNTDSFMLPHSDDEGYLPAVIAKSDEVDFMKAEVTAENRKGWRVLPLILVAIFVVLGIIFGISLISSVFLL